VRQDARAVGNEVRAAFADRAIDRALLFVDGFRFGQILGRLDGEHALDGPGQIDGGRSRGFDTLGRARELRVRGTDLARDDDSVRSEDSDAGCAAHR